MNNNKKKLPDFSTSFGKYKKNQIIDSLNALSRSKIQQNRYLVLRSPLVIYALDTRVRVLLLF